MPNSPAPDSPKADERKPPRNPFIAQRDELDGPLVDPASSKILADLRHLEANYTSRGAPLLLLLLVLVLLLSSLLSLLSLLLLLLQPHCCH